MPFAPLLALVIAASALVDETSAAPCASDTSRTVALTLVGAALDAAARDAIASHVRAETAARDAALCFTSDASDAASVRVRVELARRASAVAVLVDDARTGDRLQRQTDLTSVPAAARPLAIGIAVGELLRALGGSPASAPIVRAPPAATLTAESSQSVPSRAPAHWSVFGGLSLQRFGGGITLWGPELGAAVRVGERWLVGAAARFERGFDVTSTNGGGSVEALGGAAFVSRVLRERRALGVAVDITATAARLAADGRAVRGASARAGASLLGTATAGLVVALRNAGPVRPALRLAAGTCWACVALEDGAAIAATTSGWLVAATLRLEVQP